MNIANVTSVIGSTLAMGTALLAVWQATIARRSASIAQRQAIAAEEQTALLRLQLELAQKDRSRKESDDERALANLVLGDGRTVIQRARRVVQSWDAEDHDRLKREVTVLRSSVERFKSKQDSQAGREFAESLDHWSYVLVAEFRMALEQYRPRIFGQPDDHLPALAIRRLESELARLQAYERSGRIPDFEKLA